ncbi:Crystal protein [Diplonema papillatum]|nr:Crystal protein [Diplonema papillatum]
MTIFRSLLLLLLLLGIVFGVVGQWMWWGRQDRRRDPHVTVRVHGLGSVEGQTRMRGGVEVDEFLGIQYATAGRWEPPRMVDEWDGTVDAMDFGGTCFGSMCGNETEECLNLNIFRPRREVYHETFPVVVVLHGGAYAYGCADMVPFAPLAARSRTRGKDAVIVSLNYRLNIFGFLGSDRLRAADNSTGNFGFQDQRVALQWVQKYISSFGGNPNDVTVLGASAGTTSITNHLFTPKSNGLFHKVVADSSVGALWGTKPLAHAELYYDSILALTNCSDSACLKSVSAPVLSATVGLSIPPNVVGSGFFAWSPVIDGVEIKAHPYSLLPTYRPAQPMPFMGGTSRDEYAFVFVQGALDANVGVEVFMGVVNAYLPQDSRTPARLAQAVDMYNNTEEYPADLGPYSKWWWALMRAISHHDFVCPHRRAVRYLAEQSDNVYSYHFIRPTKSFVLNPVNRQQFPGTGNDAVVVPHAIEVPYLVNCSKDASDCGFNVTSEQALAEDLSGYAVDFFHSGTLPYPWFPQDAAVNDELLVDVSPADGGQGFAVETSFKAVQCEFWEAVLDETVAGL